MSAATFVACLLFLLAVALLLCAVWPATIEDEPATLALGHRWLYELVEIAYDEDLVIVTPRGVELPYSPSWDIDDVIDTLAEVDAL